MISLIIAVTAYPGITNSKVDRAGGRARFGCFSADGGEERWGGDDVGDCPEADGVGVVVAAKVRKESVVVFGNNSSARR